jgi:hypothetical protein
MINLIKYKYQTVIYNFIDPLKTSLRAESDPRVSLRSPFSEAFIKLKVKQIYKPTI